MTISFPHEEFYPRVDADLPEGMTLHRVDMPGHGVAYMWCFMADTELQVDGVPFSSKVRAIAHANAWFRVHQKESPRHGDESAEGSHDPEVTDGR